MYAFTRILMWKIESSWKISLLVRIARKSNHEHRKLAAVLSKLANVCSHKALVYQLIFNRLLCEGALNASK